MMKDVDLPTLRGEVCLDNPLIEARKNFNLMGMRIFMLGLQGINPHLSTRDKFFDEEFKETFITAKQLTEIFGNTKYLHEMKAACTRLYNATIELGRFGGGKVLKNMFRRLEYVSGKGLYICFHDVMRPYILDMFKSRGYTRMNAKHVFKLSSPYAIRLLELLQQYQNIKEFQLRQEVRRDFTVEELRFFLNVPEGAYKGRLNNFRRFVLDNPIREINQRTCYKIHYQTMKVGVRVVGFRFKMDLKNVPLAASDKRNLKFKNDAIETLLSLGFTERVARAIFSKCLDVPDCFSRINRAQALLYRSKTPIRNKLGFLREAIENDWRVEGDPPMKPSKAPEFTSDKQMYRYVLKQMRKQAQAQAAEEESFEETREPEKSKKPVVKVEGVTSIGDALKPIAIMLKQQLAEMRERKLQALEEEKPVEEFKEPEESKKPVKVEGVTSIGDVLKPFVAELKEQLAERQERELPPPSPKKKPYKNNKYKIPEDEVNNIKDWLRDGKDIEIAKEVLEAYGLTLEKFREEFY